MRNPEIAMNKLEKLEGKLKTMDVMLTRPGTSAENYKHYINECEEIIADLKTMIQRQS
jgi:hypothetical protein|tara:strand:+ start:70 stop:243 length:174 start_codon:yes stop_codon:yes gene_type:complete